jgi:hypothetical protein
MTAIGCLDVAAGLLRYAANHRVSITACQREACANPAGEVITLPSRFPERRLVPAARLDELLGRAAMVGMRVGHGAAQLRD